VSSVLTDAAKRSEPSVGKLGMPLYPSEILESWHASAVEALGSEQSSSSAAMPTAGAYQQGPPFTPSHGLSVQSGAGQMTALERWKGNELVVEVPQVQFREKVVEVPTLCTKETVRAVPKIEVHEIIKEVP
jgi:hypothetical protein